MAAPTSPSIAELAGRGLGLQLMELAGQARRVEDTGGLGGAPAQTAWYFDVASGDALWNTLTNWRSNSDGSGTNPPAAPWTVDDDSKSMDLRYVEGATETVISIPDVGAAFAITGTCFINIVSNGNVINSGTFAYDVDNNGSITGGTWAPTIGTFFGGGETNGTATWPADHGGCMDGATPADNYDATATWDNGSCTYP